jgi:hypothetical protein
MTDEPRNVTALQARIRNEANRKGRAANTLERLVANVVVGQMLLPGVIKGGTALKVRMGDAHTRFSRDLDAARQAGATLDEYLDELDANLQAGWHGFTGTIRPGTPSRVPPTVPPAYIMTGRTDTAGADYIDIVQAVTDHVAPAHVHEDLVQLYRRMTFNVLAGNRDDHLRNHGFLRHPDGWRLAPAFDLNPAREVREHATAVNGRVATPDAADVLGVRSFFGLTERGARAIIAEVADAVGEWRSVAAATGIARDEQDQVAVAFRALPSAAAL